MGSRDEESEIVNRRTENTLAKCERPKTNTLHKTDLATRAPLKAGANSGSSEGSTVHAPYVTLVVLLHDMNIICY